MFVSLWRAGRGSGIELEIRCDEGGKEGESGGMRRVKRRHGKRRDMWSIRREGIWAWGKNVELKG